jgi:hypothetical protein
MGIFIDFIQNLLRLVFVLPAFFIPVLQEDFDLEIFRQIPQIRKDFVLILLIGFFDFTACLMLRLFVTLCF